MDRIPEIMDGKNVADYVDQDIDAKLALLEQEEDQLQVRVCLPACLMAGLLVLPAAAATAEAALPMLAGCSLMCMSRVVVVVEWLDQNLAVLTERV